MQELNDWVSEIVGEEYDHGNYTPNALGKTFDKEYFEEFLTFQVQKRINDDMYNYISKHTQEVLDMYCDWEPDEPEELPWT